MPPFSSSLLSRNSTLRLEYAAELMDSSTVPSPGGPPHARAGARLLCGRPRPVLAVVAAVEIVRLAKGQVEGRRRRASAGLRKQVPY